VLALMEVEQVLYVNWLSPTEASLLAMYVHPKALNYTQPL